MNISILYFSWIREALGIEAETVAVPAHVTGVASLVDWLQGRDEKYAVLLDERLRCAVDQYFVALNAPLSAGSEVAFFPPVTGG